MFVKTRVMKSFGKTTTRAVELWRQRAKRAARGRGACGVGEPAVRPQHVEVRVEENRSTWKCVLRRNRRFTMYARRVSTSSLPADTRGTVNDAVKASS